MLIIGEFFNMEKLIVVTLGQTNKNIIGSRNLKVRKSPIQDEDSLMLNIFHISLLKVFLKCVLQCLISDELQLKAFPHSLQS